MAKILNYIGIAAIVVGLLFMAAGFFVGGPFVFALAAQVGLPAILSGIVFMAFGYVVELLETISSTLRAAFPSGGSANKGEPITLRLEDLAGPVRVLRSIADSTGGLNERQRTTVVDFIGNCSGGELTKSQRASVTAWIDTTTGSLDEDLATLRHASPNMQRRLKAAASSIVSASGVMHSPSPAKDKVEAAAARVAASMPTQA